jgi:hypothetical protein
MKKSIVILLVVLSNNLLFSQISKSKWLIGGSVSTDNNTFKINTNVLLSSKSSSSNFNLTPEINYVISNKFMLGGGIAYSCMKSDFATIQPPQSSATSTTNSSTNEAISVFLQAKYYVNISKNIFWNLNLKTGYGGVNYSYKSTPTSFTTPPIITNPPTSQNNSLEPKYFYSNLTTQILFIPFQRFGFQLDIGGLNYLSYNYDKIVNSDITSNNFSFNINPSNWSLGVFYVLGKQ